MIGAGFKKLARKHNMRLDAGVAYGSLMGYATTFVEGAGYKQLRIIAMYPQVGQREQLDSLIQGINLQKEYKIRQLLFNSSGVFVVFQDTVGTMKRIEAFIDWFYPLLKQVGAVGIDHCIECGEPVDNGQWYLINGAAYYLHDACAQKVEMQFAEENKARKEADKGSYLLGAVGAVLGALLGAVVWALVLYWGYIAALVGLLIGWLAIKGYDLCNGKQGKGKIAIVIVAVVLSVLVGNLGADVVTLCKMIGGGELPGATYGDIPYIISLTFQESSEYARGVLSNCIVGLLLAGLGVFGLLRKTGREVAESTVKKLM